MAIRLGKTLIDLRHVVGSRQRKSAAVPWTFRDVLLVSLSGLVPLLFFPLFALLSERSKWWNDLFLYLWTVWFLFLPIIWIKRQYRMGKEHLGLKKGRWSPMWATTIAAVAAGIYFFLASILSGRDLKIFAVMWKNALSILLLPFSIGGFCLIILMPLAEEIYYRGFLYGFLRTKLEARNALVLQALLFAFFHFEFSVSVFLELFVGGIVLGVLYEVSNSIYPSVIFHCVMSWLIYAYRAGAVI